MLSLLSISSKGYYGLKICNDLPSRETIHLEFNRYGCDTIMQGCRPNRVQTKLLWNHCHEIPWGIYVWHDYFNRINLVKIVTINGDKFGHKKSVCLKIKTFQSGSFDVTGKIIDTRPCYNNLFMPRYKIKQSPKIFGSFHHSVTLNVTGFESLNNGLARAIDLDKTCNAMQINEKKMSLQIKCRYPIKHISGNFVTQINNIKPILDMIYNASGTRKLKILNRCSQSYRDKTHVEMSCTASPYKKSQYLPPGSYLNTCKYVLYNPHTFNLMGICPEQQPISFYFHKGSWIPKLDANHQKPKIQSYLVSTLNLLNKKCNDVVNKKGTLTCV